MSEKSEYHDLDEFKKISEEEIVLLAKKGDDRATEYLVSKYMGYARTKVKSYFLLGGDKDDFIQECMIGLYKAIRDFDVTKNVHFKTFAELCITRHIITAVQSASRMKHTPLNRYVSLDEADIDSYYIDSVQIQGEQRDLNPEEIMIEKENIEGMECQFDKLLSPFEAQVLMYHLDGFPYVKIAEFLSKDAKSVDNALQRIKKKLERFLETDKA